VNSETEAQTPNLNAQSSNQKHLFRLKILAVLFTVGGIALFGYFIYRVGFDEVLAGVGRIGFGGFAIILFLYFLRICTRAAAWKLSVYEPYKLELRDTIPAVIIGEAMSSLIPLGILVSGTSKALAVKHRVPLVVGFSSIATENLFYSFVTSLFIVFGAFSFLRTFELASGWIIAIDVLIVTIIFLILLGILAVLRQWHFASAICDAVYKRGFLVKILENGRLHVRLFENFIYGFYRRYPKRFVPICLLEVAFHALGIFEVWYILSRISENFPSVYISFLLEAVSRLITVVFKLIPFVIGIDEAGSQFITETLAAGTGIGVMLAIIRKGKILFWTSIGLIFIIKRGFSFKEISKIRSESHDLTPE
jgi:Lysylphosphatidylglycerol synthase TM region